jgi:hypothetical protein
VWKRNDEAERLEGAMRLFMDPKIEKKQPKLQPTEIVELLLEIPNFILVWYLSVLIIYAFFVAVLVSSVQDNGVGTHVFEYYRPFSNLQLQLPSTMSTTSTLHRQCESSHASLHLFSSLIPLSTVGRISSAVVTWRWLG